MYDVLPKGMDLLWYIGPEIAEQSSSYIFQNDIFNFKYLDSWYHFVARNIWNTNM